MDTKKRHYCDGYKGVFYREAKRIGGPGTEKVYYVAYKKDGKDIEAKVGRQYTDGMTPAKASKKRGNLIEGREESPQEKRKREKQEKEQAEIPKTINEIWEKYLKKHKGCDRREINRFNTYLKRVAGPGKKGGKPGKLYMPNKYMFGNMRPNEKLLSDIFMVGDLVKEKEDIAGRVFVVLEIREDSLLVVNVDVDESSRNKLEVYNPTEYLTIVNEVYGRKEHILRDIVLEAEIACNSNGYRFLGVKENEGCGCSGYLIEVMKEDDDKSIELLFAEEHMSYAFINYALENLLK